MKAVAFPSKIANLSFPSGLFFRSPAKFLSRGLSSSLSSPCRKLTRGRKGVGSLMSQSLSSSISSLSTSFSSQRESELLEAQLSSPKPKSPPPQFPWLIVGLGNPGKKYQGTRHNVGFEMVDALADAEGISMNTVNFKALFGKGVIGNQPILLAKPQTFMNLSGESVGQIVSFYKIPLKQVLVVYDDLDLPFGKLRLLPKGGHGGHNGMRSIIDRLKGSRDFPRLRIGIGRPPGKMDTANFVLRQFNRQEQGELDYTFQTGIEAIRILLLEGINKSSSVKGFESLSRQIELTNQIDPFRDYRELSNELRRIICPSFSLAAAMYGGDEVSAIVVDLGSHTCKAGYAGEDAPKAVFPSVVGAVDGVEAMDMDVDSTKTNSNSDDSKTNFVESGKGKRKLYVGSQALNYRRDHMEVLSPMKDGIVSDWDLVDNIWEHAFRSCLMIDPKEHPMLLAEPPLNSQQQREKAAELMFEKYKVPALFMAKNPVLTSFATGRATSLVVDCGGGSTTIAPVHDGYVLQKAVVSSPIGGEFLTDCLLKSLESKGIKIRPRYSFKRKEIRAGEFQVEDVHLPDTMESYKLFCQRMIVGDIKDSICRVPDTPYDDKSYSNIPTTSYELPDGQTLEIGADRFKVPDVMFNPSIAQTIPGMEKCADMIPSARGLPHMVMESINKCDVDIRRELYSSILLAGGTSSMQQLKERLEKDLIEESPHSARVKVLASGNTTERRFSVWIGGSILASLGSFQQMWFSKSEYEEHGASYIQRKCP
ncbi:Actin-related protein 4 [Cardamine amara subsp. amara]|uniref:Actin-related protein 4 n=1 Tax=Cardamine amara subsp. amara TaxID=228776 RepID=A0ABD1BHQ4_CARAN